MKILTKTSGTGRWSTVAREVHIIDIRMQHMQPDDMYGELIAVFDPTQWNIAVDGYIYTDKLWMETFTEHLALLGFSHDAIHSDHGVSYSEYGMQHSLYVSMDVGKLFCEEWCHMVAKTYVDSKNDNVV